jgi:hypothetical protein
LWPGATGFRSLAPVPSLFRYIDIVQRVGRDDLCLGSFPRGASLREAVDGGERYA